MKIPEHITQFLLDMSRLDLARTGFDPFAIIQEKAVTPDPLIELAGSQAHPPGQPGRPENGQ
jgi:hypothetical protein